MNFLEELETLRKKIIKKIIICGIVSLIVLILLVVIFNEINVFAIVVICSIITKVIISSDEKKFKSIYKKDIALAMFDDIFTDISYNTDEGISESAINETGMMYTGDVFSSNDHIKAKYKNINFESSDVHIQERHEDSDGNTTYDTLFKGQWFIFDFNKTFKANIQVCEKSFYGSKLDSAFSGKKYHKVSMEDVNFNKTFKIYAENELDAFYVLTPHLMEKIKELNNKLNGNILFCFIENKLHIGLHNHKDLFEPKLFKKISLDEEKQKILDEMKIITEFVDILDLDNDLFKRRD